MRWLITDHAVERYVSRHRPELLHRQARAELEGAIAQNEPRYAGPAREHGSVYALDVHGQDILLVGALDRDDRHAFAVKTIITAESYARCARRGRRNHHREAA